MSNHKIIKRGTAKSGRRAKRGKKKMSWEAKELDDIRKYWKPGWLSDEGKRRANKRTT